MKIERPETKVGRVAPRMHWNDIGGAVRTPHPTINLFTRGMVVAAVLSTVLLQAATYQNPVLPGDYPDPSVIRVGDDYWATATTSEWAPLFPLLHSRDLVNWEHVGNIFERRPDWAVGNFWAPELFEHQGKFYVYYVGRKKGGPLSLAVATADKATGPWKDHGPLVGQDAGSIDAFPVVDTDGTRYLIWKEDGNSRKQPTPLWIQKLSDDGLKLVGEMKELFRNDTAWENNLVEGPAVIRRGDYWYLFYAGNACCGRGCNYAQGVARAKNLLGPWEKNPGNPLLIGSEKWKCPGHGTLVRDKAGRDWFLYHAYAADTFTYVGRQGVLDLVNWKDDGWPVINNGTGVGDMGTAPTRSGQLPQPQFREFFVDNWLSPLWQWPQNNEPRWSVGRGRLVLTASENQKDPFASAVLAVKSTRGDYTATASIYLLSLNETETAGLSAFGDRENALGVSIKHDGLVLWKRQRNKLETLGSAPLPGNSTLWIRMSVTNGHRFSFSASTDRKDWKKVGDNIDVEGNYLPPWDRGIRVALVAGGENASVEYHSLIIEPR